MNPQTQELIKTERRRSDFSYIAEVIQGGRIRPSTYVHELILPDYLYEELRDRNVINNEDYYILKQAFFEFRRDNVIISFQHLYACEDLHHRIDRYLVVKAFGNYPIQRAGISKMNFDIIGNKLKKG